MHEPWFRGRRADPERGAGYPRRVTPGPKERMGLFDFLKQREAPRPARTSFGPVRPEPKAENNFLVVILDSCRFDTFMQAEPKSILKLGPVEKRWSYASWTAPSHYNLLTGLLPHSSPPN